MERYFTEESRQKLADDPWRDKDVLELEFEHIVMGISKVAKRTRMRLIDRVLKSVTGLDAVLPCYLDSEAVNEFIAKQDHLTRERIYLETEYEPITEVKDRFLSD